MTAAVDEARRLNPACADGWIWVATPRADPTGKMHTGYWKHPPSEAWFVGFESPADAASTWEALSARPRPTTGKATQQTAAKEARGQDGGEPALMTSIERVQYWLGQAETCRKELLAHRDGLLAERHEIDAKLVVVEGLLAQLEGALQTTTPSRASAVDWKP